MLRVLGSVSSDLVPRSRQSQKRSPDFLNNVNRSRTTTAYNETYFVLPYMGVEAILVK